MIQHEKGRHFDASPIRRLALDQLDGIFGARRSGLRAVLRPNDDVPAYDVEPDATITRLPELLRLVDGWIGAEGVGRNR